MIKRLCALFVALSIIAVCGVAQAKTFVVAVENIDYYPLYSGAKKDYTGYARELLDEFAKSKGYTFKYEPLPLNRLFKAFLQKGEYDFKFPDNPYWSADMREGKNVTYSESVAPYVDGVLVKPANKGKSAVKKLGLVTGFTAWEYLGEIKAGRVKIEENNNYESLLKKAMKGRIDGAYSNIAVANYQINNIMKKPGELVFDDALPHTKSHYYMSTLKHPEVIAELNAFMVENKSLVDSIKAKYKVLDF